MTRRSRGWAGLVLPLVLLLAVATASATDEREKHDDLQRLLRLAGSLNNAKQAIGLLMPQMIASFKKINPAIPDKVWTDAERIALEEVDRAIPDLEEPLIAIYGANFSAEEVKQLIAFYESPIGRKLVGQMPTILQQSVAVSQVWGSKIGERMKSRIREHAKQNGYEL
jgi:uncharacterized protein